MNTVKLELIGLKKEYEDGAVVAVDGIDLAVIAGETIALLGSSGCGKSTTLNMIVGLEDPSAGDIRINGSSVLNIPAGKRPVGLVFQDYAVFSSMTVRENLAFGLAVRNMDRQTIAEAVDETAELLGIKDQLNIRAKNLGGSQLQRVAIGRTLVTRPEILLLDEPLSNLEMEARVAMRRELRRLQEEIGLTIIYVTHDQVEALSLADRIAVMHCGKILQLEETTQICNRPDHLFVADFLGSPPMNLVSGEFQMLDGIVHFVHDSLKIKAGEALSACAGAPSGIHAMGIRPDAIRLVPSTSAPIAGRIMLTELRGPEAVVTVAVGSLNLKVLTQPDTIYREGDSVGLSMDPSAILFYSKETSRRINLAPLR